MNTMRHRRIPMCISVGLALSSALSGPVLADVYANVRFGYQITYPAEFRRGRESDNGDGIVLHPLAKSQADFRVYGSYNALNQSPSDLAAETAHDCTREPTLLITNSRLVAVSCISGTDVIYRRTLISSERLVTFFAKYPRAEMTHWDAALRVMAGSLRINSVR